ncbi:Lrp/AsnC family transcriptional regulator [Acuticoccus yangtzensis]|uniref:Lrp/AsnC family transcriptional regulator n=1 Tax=Acuticoccus yangtzensis TaxID=1443441 RepID=UPI000949A2CD|nr:Lrp/AsnC family transcriptional regulator [Acuticoccus yangtzensis]
MDDLDRRILTILQQDATLPVERIAAMVNSSKSPVWNRIRKLREMGIIDRQVAILDPQKVDRGETFFVMVKTSQHAKDWLDRFAKAVEEMGEILEAHRLAGEIDYILKVRVRDTRAFDAFYKRLVRDVELFSVTSQLSMETLKETTALDLTAEQESGEAEGAAKRGGQDARGQ